MKPVRLLLIMFLAVGAVVPARARRIPETIIKVGIVQRVHAVNLSCEGRYYLYELNSGARYPIQPLNDYRIIAEEGRLIIDGKTYTSPVRIVYNEGDNRLRIDGRRYRDTLLITCNGSKMTVINELGLEDYLYGILPREANPAWPLESLKAQAVTSRTYVLRNLRRHCKDGYDVCTQTHCQVYGGMESEDPRCSAAVDETRGVVLVYQGELAQTLFHASCGGHTENPNNVWNWESVTPPYLKGRPDRYCGNSPHHEWESTLSGETIRKRLVKAGYKVDKILRIKVDGKSKSGRARVLVVRHRNGELRIPAGKFRLAVDSWLIRSTMFRSITAKGSGFRFTGLGWGHGVGMCQWGAKEMAEQGKDYEDILRFYYPGTRAEKWED